MAQATGRAKYQPVRVTRPRAASAGRVDTSRRGETSGTSCRTSQAPAGPRDKTRSGQREASGHQPAERDQWRELPDEPGASGSALRVRAEANQSSGKAPEGQARAEKAKLRVTPGTSSAKEFEDGRKRQAALRRSSLLRH